MTNTVVSLVGTNIFLDNDPKKVISIDIFFLTGEKSR